jgi:hypothetical protein
MTPNLGTHRRPAASRFMFADVRSRSFERSQDSQCPRMRAIVAAKGAGPASRTGTASMIVAAVVPPALSAAANLIVALGD